MKAAYIVLGVLGVATVGYIVYRRSQGQPLLPGTQPTPPPQTLPTQPLTKRVLQQTINEVLNNPNPGSQPVVLKQNVLLNKYFTYTEPESTNFTNSVVNGLLI